MKAWQLTTGLTVVAASAGWLTRHHLTTVLRPGDNRGVVIETDPVRQASAGPLDREALVDAIDPTIWLWRQAIKYCFFAESQRETQDAWDVVLRFRIEPTGVTHDASISEPAGLHGSRLEQCLSLTVQGIQFPAFVGPAVWVQYPL